jgi:hypothetical protein
MLTGEVVRDVLATRNVEYRALVYSVGLFDGPWAEYRSLVEGVWGTDLRGRYSIDEAIAKTPKAVTPPK